MIKRLTKHGNSHALIIDRALLDVLEIDPDTPLKITTDGRSLKVTPVRKPRDRAFLEAKDAVFRQYRNALRKLAE